jgi:ParB family transcriptional regulator, chromosome partitioning protein
MGKADDLLRTMGGTITESASHRGAPAAMPTAASAPPLKADRLAGVTRSKAALEIPVARIERDPDQPREEFDDDALGRLAESIRTRGIIQPITVRWDEGRGVYAIICGERRWRASQLAGLATIPCTVSDRPAGPGELLALQMVENLLREDLKPIEQAKAFRALMTVNNWSGNQLSKELGISQSGVVQALVLLELPEAVQAAVDGGDLPASSAYAIATLDDAEAQAEVAAKAVSGRLSRVEVVEAVRARAATTAKGRGAKLKAAKRPPKPRVFRTSVGKITIELKVAGAEALLTALREATRTIEAELSAGDQAAA